MYRPATRPRSATDRPALRRCRLCLNRWNLYIVHHPCLKDAAAAAAAATDAVDIGDDIRPLFISGTESQESPRREIPRRTVFVTAASRNSPLLLVSAHRFAPSPPHHIIVLLHSAFCSDKIINFPHHVLHSLLPPPTTASQNYQLRRRTQSLQLPTRPTQLMDCTVHFSFACYTKALIRLCLHP